MDITKSVITIVLAGSLAVLFGQNSMASCFLPLFLLSFILAAIKASNAQRRQREYESSTGTKYDILLSRNNLGGYTASHEPLNGEQPGSSANGRHLVICRVGLRCVPDYPGCAGKIST